MKTIEERLCLLLDCACYPNDDCGHERCIAIQDLYKIAIKAMEQRDICVYGQTPRNEMSGKYEVQWALDRIKEMNTSLMEV